MKYYVDTCGFQLAHLPSCVRKELAEVITCTHALVPAHMTPNVAAIFAGTLVGSLIREGLMSENNLKELISNMAVTIEHHATFIGLCETDELPDEDDECEEQPVSAEDEKAMDRLDAAWINAIKLTRS